ncbi:hypothetical protein Bphy_7122 (plasmid) [Paraburkholderia phymatum STM815]|uniref:Uncharacterized protein n=1 Tax=Paraburkholderia phymatum (strain DSM 17167 / CIP 108236 / LMG 21445 / STM815) TaxID=391038 RepID=B2JU70_PARP8|nr:hypothetical protein Bphy_7122 [Paraburkholderia phymatum STM815]
MTTLSASASCQAGHAVDKGARSPVTVFQRLTFRREIHFLREARNRCNLIIKRVNEPQDHVTAAQSGEGKRERGFRLHVDSVSPVSRTRHGVLFSSEYT